jgi:Di-haem oxidoreductase, putative peroxidase
MSIPSTKSSINGNTAQIGRAVLFAAIVSAGCFASVMIGQSVAKDPGVRGGEVDAGQPLDLSQVPGGTDFFNDGQKRFKDVEMVQGGPNIGLGPRYNSNSCASCHAQPSEGGSSPSTTDYPFLGPNPQTLVANLNGQTHQNTIPSFITADGPVREARFKVFLEDPDTSQHAWQEHHRDASAFGSGPTSPSGPVADGGVHDLYVISGRQDAGTCSIKQPNFAANLAANNVIFRIPTPVYGAGLIENIDDVTIRSNAAQNAQAKAALGISGHVNTNGNDGTLTRFGWKAQNKSLEVFAGEAYNVEMGVTNELFPTERPSPDEALKNGLPPECKLNPTPEDATNMTVSPDSAVPSDVVNFAMFMRMLAPPTPSTTSFGGAMSISNGSKTFNAIGCALCHTPSLRTAPSSMVPGLGPTQANLFSDLLVHHMGNNLADGVTQGGAGPDEFRSAPLWGLGQRIFFLHDGRTKDLVDAIREHASEGSEANGVIRNYNNLNPQQQQDLLNFLRSL